MHYMWLWLRLTLILLVSMYFICILFPTSPVINWCSICSPLLFFTGLVSLPAWGLPLGSAGQWRWIQKGRNHKNLNHTATSQCYGLTSCDYFVSQRAWDSKVSYNYTPKNYIMILLTLTVWTHFEINPLLVSPKSNLIGLKKKRKRWKNKQYRYNKL